MGTPPARELRNRWTTGPSRQVEEITAFRSKCPLRHRRRRCSRRCRPPRSSSPSSSSSSGHLRTSAMWRRRGRWRCPRPSRPAVVNTTKPRIKQICKALEAIWEFSDVMENYLDEKESEEFLAARQQLEEEAARQQRPLVNSGVKRKGEDPDHVFLRFGKRSHY